MNLGVFFGYRAFLSNFVCPCPVKALSCFKYGHVFVDIKCFSSAREVKICELADFLRRFHSYFHFLNLFRYVKPDSVLSNFSFFFFKNIISKA